MKKIVLVFSIILFGATSVAQNKNAKTSIEVDGVCMMCKDRIEKAAIKAKGVKSAQWDVNTHMLSLIYNEQKTSIANIEQSIADSGHDTNSVKAKDEVYNAIDDCCKYRDPNVVEDHKNE